MTVILISGGSCELFKTARNMCETAVEDTTDDQFVPRCEELSAVGLNAWRAMSRASSVCLLISSCSKKKNIQGSE